MNITFAQYQKEESTNMGIAFQLNGDNTQSFFVPLDPANRHYAEIMRQVEAGTLTIQEADNG